MGRSKTRMWMAGLALLGLLLAAGCETTTLENEGTITLAHLEGIVEPEPGQVENGSGPGEPGDPEDGSPGDALFDDAVPFGNLRWNRGGENYSGAQRDSRVTLHSVAVRGGNPPTLTYRGDGLRVWPIYNADITHMWAIFFDDNQDGIFQRGGKFDWGRSSASARPLHHLQQGYNGWDGYPRSGTPWAAVITDKSGRHRSNVVTGFWP
jgi:hypothetical protein